ncbi:tensin-1-like isoform X3 [Mya arenaria]|uniref:tensin-1-like isoform X3 n=1 Tax=Mya arenaria TaxID=6604 RepID=UPI0022E5FB23|nr:tensin-1-like isoform X3 [Mya arenaria]
MLKFATKKPPRYKHFEHGDLGAYREGQGDERYYGDEGGSIRLAGDYTRFDPVNGDDMLDYYDNTLDYSQNLPEFSDSSYHGNKEYHRPNDVGHGPGHARPSWKAPNVKYGILGQEVHQPVPNKEVGMSRNGQQRSEVNPGFVENTLDHRKMTDLYRDDIDGQSGGQQYYSGQQGLNDLSRGQGQRSNYGGQELRDQEQGMGNYYQGQGHEMVKPSVDISSRQMLYQRSDQPFPVLSLSSEPTYSVDSTTSMSIDSMSGTSIGDRSSKSTLELQDYDLLLDMPQVTRRGIDVKPPVPQKHKHIHVGRGTHGICEGPVSHTRPGSSESHMTSSLRKSPSGVKSGHHVRWDPGVVNSGSKQTLIPLSELQPKSPPTKRGKKKTSLRNLLNLPKMSFSDNESSDQEGSSKRESSRHRTEGTDNRGTLKKLLDGRSGCKRKEPVASGQSAIITTTSSEIASLRYRNEYQINDNLLDSQEFSHQRKGNVAKLDITKANQGHSLFPGRYYDQNTDYDPLQQTDSISHPIVHSRSDRSILSPQPKYRPVTEGEFRIRSPVRSVRPFLINGQANESQDYDNFTESETSSRNLNLISVSSKEPDKLNVLHQGKVSSLYANEKKTPQYLNEKQVTTLPVTVVSFDTFVTHGRPSDSNVTFDTFVTLGRPFATSTPVPNGISAFSQYVSQQTPNVHSSDNKDVVSRTGDGRVVAFHVASGHPSSSVTQSWNYTSGSLPGARLPMATQTVTSSMMEPGMKASGFPEQHSGHMTSGSKTQDYYLKHLPTYNREITGPYEMDNRNYGKLNLSPTTFLMEAPGPFFPTSSPPVQSDFSKVSKEQVQSNAPKTANDGVKTMEYKDQCRFKEREHSDYDDDVFQMFGLSPLKGDVPGKNARRKLEFEGTSSFHKPVVSSCVPQINHEMNHEDTLNHNYSGYPKVQVVPGISQVKSPSTTMSSNMNEMEHDRTDGDSCILDLVYITERIISMSFASEEHENTYKYNLKEVTRMLKTKHGENYLVINISEKKSDLAKHCPQVLEFGWPDNLAPPLERLCSICKAIDQWMASDINHVMVVHCKGGRGRIAVVIAAYMRYSNICASADQALDRFAMKRFYDDKLGGLPQPSQRRYVHYFAGLLSGAIQINSSALYLHHILIHGVPNFDTNGGCRPFIKVYQGMHPIFTSGVYNVTDNMQKVCISISPGIPLRGDILIKCYHKKNNAGQRDIIWGCQFHTCAISHNSLVFSKNELDDAINDPRFPDPGKVEFVFGNNSEGLVQVADFKSDVTVPVDDSTEAMTRWDSYENFGKTEGKLTDVNANGLQSSTQYGVDSFRVTQPDHTQGPVDGGLYAQVNKRKLESQIITNGTSTRQQNGGSYTSSLDSGISAFSVPVGSTTHKTTSSENWSYRKEEMNKQPVSSYSSMSKSYSSSASPRSGKVALDEQTQLDQILSDLLSDQAFVSQKSSPGTRSFRTVEEHTNPEGNIVVQRGDVTYKIPEVRSEKQYSVKTESRTVMEDKYKPVNAFTYTPSSPEMSRSFDGVRSPTSPKAPYKVDYDNNYKKESYNYQANGPSSLSDGEHSLSWLQQQQAKLREKSVERDPRRERNEQMLIEELKKSQTQNKYFQKKSEDDSMSKVSSSSLQNGPTSPYSYTVSRTHTYDTDKSPNERAFPPHDSIPMAHSHTTYITEQQSSTTSKVSNKPPPSPSLQRSVAPSMHSPPPVPPPQRTSSRDYMQQQQHQQQQHTRNRSYSGGAYQQQSSNAWKSETHAQPRVVQRHNSESAYDRDHFERQQTNKQFVTPPISPRSVSPHTFQSYKTVYKTIHHKDEDEPDFSQPQMEVKMEKQIQKEQHMHQQQQQQQQHDSNKPHYITEVIVQRTGGADSKNSTLNRSAELDRETDNRLDALEKSLQAASHSIIQNQPTWQQQQQQNVVRQETRQYETRTYETRSEQQRREHKTEQQTIQQNQANQQPHKLEVTEVDRITLKPIGPGIQQLEPEGSVHSTSTLGRDSTLGRATTPSFPTSPQASAEQYIQAVHEKVRRMSIGSNQSLNSVGCLVTPPFPLTPRTPYANTSSANTSYNYQQGSRSAQSFNYGLQSSPYGQQSSVYGPPSSGYSHTGSVSGIYGPPSSVPHYSSQQSLNSVFEREEPQPQPAKDYNTILSRQLMHSTNDPTYASINDSDVRNQRGGSHVTSPTGTLQSDRMQYQTQYQQNYQTNTLPHNGQQQMSAGYQSSTLPHNVQPQMSAGYQSSTLPHNMQPQMSAGYQTSTLPHQSGFQQHQQKQQYQQSSSYSTQQYSSSNQQSSHDGSLHVDTNPRMLMTQPARSPGASSPGSPPSPGNLNTLRHQLHTAHSMSNSAVSPGPHSATGQSSPSVYFGLSRRGSLTSLADSEATHTTPRFVKDTSKYWYKPSITREEAIMILKDKAPGTFVVRDSNSFPGAFGLALKVATLPPNVQIKSSGDPQADLVRHFLIEPTSKGVRLRGCSNEPVFGSLASLVYQHSLTPLALPCKLVLPEGGGSVDQSHTLSDVSPTAEMPSSATQLLAQGAACNVVYLSSVDMESLTGPQAIQKAVKQTIDNPPPKTTQVHFKVSNHGITLTDNQRKLFFRRHYPVATVTFCGTDPDDRKWRYDSDVPGVPTEARVFGFVARKQGAVSDNQCHLFCELDPTQPASAIVNFVTKVMIGHSKVKS